MRAADDRDSAAPGPGAVAPGRNAVAPAGASSPDAGAAEPAGAGEVSAPSAWDSRPNVSVMGLLLGTGPRFARDAVGPVLGFYIAWKLGGLVAGVATATVISAAAYAWERTRARTGLGAAIGLSVALVQAVTGLASGSAAAYLAPPVIANALYGLVFLGSVVIGRPLAAVFAAETYPFPDEIKRTKTFRRVFSRISLAWAFYLLARSALRIAVLAHSTIDVYIIVNVLTGFPFTAALITWSVWYGVRSFRLAVRLGRLT